MSSARCAIAGAIRSSSISLSSCRWRRALLLKTGWIADVGTMSVIITTAGVLGSLALFWAVRGSRAKFLFERPAQFWLVPKPAPKPKLMLQPAE
jgi:hypothetical protein